MTVSLQTKPLELGTSQCYYAVPTTSMRHLVSHLAIGEVRSLWK
jgi:hypothetical protein